MKKEDYFKYRVQGGDIYVLPEEIFDELFNELVSLQQENQELKDQLEQSIAVSDTNSELAESYYNENQKLKGSLQTHEILLRANVEENQRLKEQQKEFIEWLIKESQEVIRDAGYHQRICEDILDKYKEITGSDK